MESRNKLRDIQAKKYIQYLSDALAMKKNKPLSDSRDHALKTLDDARNSDLYASIHNDIGHYEISAYEYLFYSLVTDDVKTIDHHLLKNILSYAALPHSLYRNLRIVTAALSYSRATSPSERKRLHGELLGELGADLTYENAVRAVFLNLAGIHLSGLDCTDKSTHQNSFPNLSYSDLRGAEFTDCNFYYLKMRNSDISDARFTNVTNQYQHGHSDFHLHDSIAKGAQFNNVTVGNNDWSGCDFSGASFNNSTLGDVRLDGSNFTGATFTNTNLFLARSNDTNFTNVDFTTASFQKIDFDRNLFTNVRIIAPKTPADLAAEITRVTKTFIDNLNGSAVHVTSQLPAYQRIITADVERYIKLLDMSDDEKQNLLRDAMHHDFFNYTYMEATKSFVAEPFLTQANTIVCYGDYDPDHFAKKFDQTSMNVYHSIYDYGMSVLKKVAEAAKSPDKLEESNKRYAESLQAGLQIILKTEKVQAQLPPDLKGKDSKDVMDGAVDEADKIDPDNKLSGLNKKLLITLILSRLDVMIYGTDLMANKKVSDESKIQNEISSWHPLMTLRHYKDSNCLAPFYLGDKNNGAYHTVDALIKEFTSEARLMPPVAVKSPSVSKVPATLFSTSIPEKNEAPEQNSESTCRL